MADIRVHNIAEVNAQLRKFDAATRFGLVKEFVPIGKTVAAGAQARALTSIRHMHLSPQWAAMRVGVLSRSVYVAPVKRGRRRGQQKRKNLAPLMLNRAMRPALLDVQPQVVAKAQGLISRNVAKFNKGGF